MRHLAAHNLVGQFQAVVAHGDYAASKPAPDPFLLAAERLGVEVRLCLALEDSFNGVRSASSAGMMTVMVPDIVPPTDEIRSLCAMVADDLHAVRSLIMAAAGSDRPVCKGADVVADEPPADQGGEHQNHG